MAGRQQLQQHSGGGFTATPAVAQQTHQHYLTLLLELSQHQVT